MPVDRGRGVWEAVLDQHAQLVVLAHTDLRTRQGAVQRTAGTDCVPSASIDAAPTAMTYCVAFGCGT